MLVKSIRVNDAPQIQSQIRDSWDPLQRAERRIEAARRLAELQRMLCGEMAAGRN